MKNKSLFIIALSAMGLTGCNSLQEMLLDKMTDELNETLQEETKNLEVAVEELQEQTAKLEAENNPDTTDRQRRTIRCDILTPEYGLVNLLSESTLESPNLKYSQEQIQNRVCNSRLQADLHTSSFNIACYELQVLDAQASKYNMKINDEGFKADYQIDCPSSPSPVDYSDPGSGKHYRDISIVCEYDLERTKQEFGYTPHRIMPFSSGFEGIVFDRKTMTDKVTEHFCKNNPQFHHFVVKCNSQLQMGTTPFYEYEDFYDEMYIKAICPGAENKSMSDVILNREYPSLKLAQCTLKDTNDNHFITSELFNFKENTPEATISEDFLKSRYCTEAIQSLYPSHKYNIECSPLTIDKKNNFVQNGDVIKHTITCSDAPAVDYTSEGSGEMDEYSCFVSPYYTEKEYHWTVRGVPSISIHDTPFTRSVLAKKMEKSLCVDHLKNWSMYKGMELMVSQLEDKDFVVQCTNNRFFVHTTEPEKTMLFKTSCRDTNQIPQDNVRNFKADVSVKGKKTGQSETAYSYIDPNSEFIESKLLKKYCAKQYIEKYGKSFDMHWYETNMNGQPLDNGSFTKDIHIDCSKYKGYDLKYRGSGKLGALMCSIDNDATKEVLGTFASSMKIQRMGEMVFDPLTNQASFKDVQFSRKIIEPMLVPNFCDGPIVPKDPVIIGCTLNLNYATQAAEEEMYFKLVCPNADKSNPQSNNVMMVFPSQPQDNMPIAGAMDDQPGSNDTGKKPSSSSKLNINLAMMNGLDFEEVNYTCKLTLPNDRKVLFTSEGTASSKLTTFMTDEWAISRFCDEKFQIENHSDKYDLNCFETKEGKQVSNFAAVSKKITCPAPAKIDYKAQGSGETGFVSCKTDSLHTQQEFKWNLEKDFGFALPGDVSFRRKSLTGPVKSFLCKDPRVSGEQVVVRCALNSNAKTSKSEENLYLKINCK